MGLCMVSLPSPPGLPLQLYSGTPPYFCCICGFLHLKSFEDIFLFVWDYISHNHYHHHHRIAIMILIDFALCV